MRSTADEESPGSTCTAFERTSTRSLAILEDPTSSFKPLKAEIASSALLILSILREYEDVGFNKVPEPPWSTKVITISAPNSDGVVVGLSTNICRNV